LKQAQFESDAKVNPALLEEGPENDLFTTYLVTSQRVARADYVTALETIAALRPFVDLFFDKVLVNAKDEQVRANRLALLSSMRREFSTIADFSEIITISQETKE